jgi:hypothetical protein
LLKDKPTQSLCSPYQVKGKVCIPLEVHAIGRDSKRKELDIGPGMYKKQLTPPRTLLSTLKHG